MKAIGSEAQPWGKVSFFRIGIVCQKKVKTKLQQTSFYRVWSIFFCPPPPKTCLFHCLLLSVYLSFPYSIVYLTFNLFVCHVAFCLHVCLSTFLLFKLKSTQVSIFYIFTCLIAVENRRVFRQNIKSIKIKGINAAIVWAFIGIFS